MNMNDDKLKTAADIYTMHEMARQARLICNDIIRQTSLKPYYGKRGGAAMYAVEDRSAEQLKRIKQALDSLNKATELLRDIAVAGGMTHTQIAEDMQGDYWRTKVTIIEDDAETQQ